MRRWLTCSIFLMGCALVDAQTFSNTVTVTPSPVSLTYTLLSEKVVSQQITISTATGASVSAGVSLINGGTPSNFLSVYPTACSSTPCMLTVSPLDVVLNPSLFSALDKF